MTDEFNPDWKLSPQQQMQVALSLSLPKHIPDWPGCTDEQMEAVAADLLRGPSPTPSPITNGFEEKARQIVRRWNLSAYYVKGGCGDECGCVSGVCELAVSAISTALEEAVREARLQEREECAKIVMKHSDSFLRQFHDNDKISLELGRIVTEVRSWATAIRNRN